MIYYLLVFALLMLYPAQLSMAMTRWTKKPVKIKKFVKGPGGKRVPKVVSVQPDLKPGEAILCCLPYSSAMHIWKALYGKYGWTIIATGLSIIGIVFRLVSVFLTQNTGLWVVSFFALWIGILLFHLLYVVTITVTAYMYSMSWFVIILCVIFPYGVVWYLCPRTAAVMKDVQDEENDIFKG